ncbi:hypothetical protein R50076_18320 [Gilvimarinus japonicus]
MDTEVAGALESAQPAINPTATTETNNDKRSNIVVPAKRRNMIIICAAQGDTNSLLPSLDQQSKEQFPRLY